MAHDRLKPDHRHVEHRPIDVQVHPEQPAARQQGGVCVLADQKPVADGGVLEGSEAHHEGLVIPSVARVPDDGQEQVQKRPADNRVVRTPVALPDLPVPPVRPAVEPEAELCAQAQAELAHAELRREGQRLPGCAAGVVVGDVLDADAQERSEGNAFALAAGSLVAVLGNAQGPGAGQHQGGERDPRRVAATGEDPSSV